MKTAVEIMHKNPEFCTLETRIPDIKYLMKKYDYHEMAVVNSEHVPVGIITSESVSDDALEEFIHPFDLRAMDRMKSVVVVKNETSLNECLELMELNHIISIPVVNELGRYCGIVKKEDILKS
jgi:CBS domain-containing protein